VLSGSARQNGARDMTKEHRPSREAKKKAVLTPKEKRAAKKSKKENKTFNIA
jgi:hypothetical protein